MHVELERREGRHELVFTKNLDSGGYYGSRKRCVEIVPITDAETAARISRALQNMEG